jgi:hypothetical protein
MSPFLPLEETSKGLSLVPTLPRGNARADALRPGRAVKTLHGFPTAAHRRTTVERRDLRSPSGSVGTRKLDDLFVRQGWGRRVNLYHCQLSTFLDRMGI